MSAQDYPPLPAPNLPRGGFPDLFTAEQMRAYVDADRAARAQVVPEPVSPNAASNAWNALRDAADPLGEYGDKIMKHARVYAKRQYVCGLADGAAMANDQHKPTSLPFQGRVERHSDQSVLVVFPSCHLASKFESELKARTP
jgi:hypothetical protein